MTIFTSQHPSQTYPTDLTLWEWLFEPTLSAASPLHQSRLGAYINLLPNGEEGDGLAFDKVRQHAIRLSHILYNEYGMRAGDAVTLFTTNTVWYPVVMWAVLRLGGRVNGASLSYTTDEMTHAMKTAKTKLVFTQPHAIETVRQAAEAVGGLMNKERIIVLENNGVTETTATAATTATATVSLQDLLKTEHGQGAEVVPHWRIPQGKTNKEICAFLNFSSGTTGLPKAVMVSHHNVIAQCMQLRQLQILPSTGQYSVLAVMPLFHITGTVRFCTYPVLLNGDVYMLPQYTVDSMLQAVSKYKIEELILVPAILTRLVREDAALKKYDLRHIKRWSSGSAPISSEVIKALQARFPWTGFRQGYGATETTACITCHPPTHFDFKYGTSSGKLVADTQVKVISLEDEKTELGVGQTGEICARGPQVAMGYLDNEEATRETFQDGWLRTGDVGHIDAEGLVYVEDRIKEMIKVKGLQVPPAELEALLLGSDAVEDCAVTSVEDQWAGERPKAYVVLKKGIEPNDATGRMLLELVKKNKVRYKWLVEVEFVDEIPKNPTGKILRRVLRLREKQGDHRGPRVRELQKARL